MEMEKVGSSSVVLNNEEKDKNPMEPEQPPKNNGDSSAGTAAQDQSQQKGESSGGGDSKPGSDAVNLKQGNNTPNPMSKRQQRKQEKQQQWQETKHLRKEKRKQKKKEFRDKKKQRLEVLKSEAAEKGLDPSLITLSQTRNKLKSNSMKNSSCKISVCVDMSFSDLMIDKDLNKCIKQVHRCYSINRRYENPLQLYITSLVGKTVDVMSKNDGWQNWDVHFHEKSYLELENFSKDNIVYLTAESENTLKELDDSKLYVIGGIVDHNSRKGLCHQLAIQNGVQHARLPLGDYIEMSRRKVLSIVHVFEILGGIAQKRPWGEVLLEVLPPRNQAKLKEDGSDDDPEEDNA